MPLIFGLTLPLFTIEKAEATTITITRTFTSLNYDGHIRANGTTYDDVHYKPIGDVYDSLAVIAVGQVIGNIIYRGYVFFDTSIIPSGATVLEAKLSVYFYSYVESKDFNVTVQNGQPTYPHMPLQPGDYYYNYYQGNGGTLNFSTLAIGNYYNITLNEQGINWINKAGVTKLCLRSSNDIDAIPPSSTERFYFRSAESDYAPKLYVTYETEGYKYIFKGPVSEGTGLQCGSINVTVYPLTGTPFTFNLTGSYILEFEEKPNSFTWTFDYNFTRTYVPLSTYEEITIFIPDTPYFYYTVEIIDFVGLHNVYVSSMVTANGTLYIAERKQIPSGGKASFCLTEFKTYSYVLTANEGVITLGSRETPPRPTWDEVKISFLVTQAMLPAEPTNYEGISLTIQRTNGTFIQVYYNDANGRTISVTITIYRVGNYGTLTQEYTQTFTAWYFYFRQSALFQWNNALPNKDYNVKVEANHADYGTITWQIPLPTPEPPGHGIFNWDELLGWLGDWPITPSNFISLMIILAAIVLGGTKDAAFALLLGAITAGILISLGWYSMSWGTLTLIVCLIIAFAIIKGRRGWIER